MVYGLEVRKTVSESITIPTYYEGHLCRFLWHHHLFMHLYDGMAELAPTLRPLLMWYIQYMNSMVEGLLTTVQKRIGDVAYCLHLFNLYLIVEFHVGHHEHDIVCRWVREHPDTILECVNIDSIGKPPTPIW